MTNLSCGFFCRAVQRACLCLLARANGAKGATLFFLSVAPRRASDERHGSGARRPDVWGACSGGRTCGRDSHPPCGTWSSLMSPTRFPRNRSFITRPMAMEAGSAAAGAPLPSRSCALRQSAGRPRRWLPNLFAQPTVTVMSFASRVTHNPPSLSSGTSPLRDPRQPARASLRPQSLRPAFLAHLTTPRRRLVVKRRCPRPQRPRASRQRRRRSRPSSYTPSLRH